MRLEISNIGWPSIPEFTNTLVNDLINVYKKKIPDIHKVLCKITEEDNKIVFHKVDGSKDYEYLFSSMVPNKFMIKDPGLIKLKGRPHLNSIRLTEDQWRGTMEVIVQTLDNLKLNADIVLINKDITKILRNKTMNYPWPAPSKFALKG